MKPASTALDVLELIPEAVRWACTAEQIFVHVYGLSPGVDACGGCGMVAELWHYESRLKVQGKHALDTCYGCGFPYPRRCETEGCGAVVPARRGRRTIAPPDTFCAECERHSNRHDRLVTLAREVGRMAADGALEDILTPTKRPWRAGLAHWVDRALTETTMALYIAGPSGTGKTRGIVWLARELYVERMRVSQLLMVRERDLIHAHRDQFDRNHEARAQEARDLLDFARDVPLLIVDEAFSRGHSAYSESASQTFAELYCRRFDQGDRFTVLASNQPALSRPGRRDLLANEPEPDTVTLTEADLRVQVDELFSGVLDGRVASRFKRVGRVLAAAGSDMRG